MNGMTTLYLWASGNYTTTHTMNFSPRWTHAYICLSKTGGDGTARAGITKYRYRLNSGADKTVTLAAPGQGLTPTQFARNKVTSVTFEIWSFDHFGYATAVATYW